MKFDNKKINTGLIISNVIFVILLSTITISNYKNYRDYTATEKNLTTTKTKLENYSNKIIELNKKIDTKNSDKLAQIDETSTQFLNAFFNYDALGKDKIYTNIKPYTTAYLMNKLEPTKKNELESDVNYKISIKNIRLYSKLQNDDDVSILVLADQEMKVNTVDTITPILIELKLSKVENKWLVNDLLINTPIKNEPFVN